MLTEGAWRKLPKDLLVDEDFAYVESLLPPEYAYAPYMFFISALRKADDNGIFDVEDLVIFSRLMRVPDIEIVKTVINGLMKRHVIYREGLSTICGFWQWEHGEGSNKPRPLKERRAIVKEKITAKENERKSVPFGDDSTQSSQQAAEGPAKAGKATDNYSQEVVTAAPQNVSLCPENDKNAQNVVKESFDDKSAKNVGEKKQTERKKERETDQTIQEEVERTHTLEQRTERETEKEGLTGYAPPEGATPVNPEEKQAVAEELPEGQELNKDIPSAVSDVDNLAEEALQVTKDEVKEKETRVSEKLTKFFVKNCYGYNKNQGAHSIQKLTKMICKVSDEINPADTICDLLCAEFKRMSDTGGPNGYWKNIPLLPSNMLKNNVWAYLMQYAGKILAAKKADNQFIREEMAAREAAEKEKKAVSVVLDQEYLKYNIDPDDPNRCALLVQAKAAEQRAAEQQEKEPEPDIF